jgi:hypothetical protein
MSRVESVTSRVSQTNAPLYCTHYSIATWYACATTVLLLELRVLGRVLVLLLEYSSTVQVVLVLLVHCNKTNANHAAQGMDVQGSTLVQCIMTIIRYHLEVTASVLLG